MYKSKKFWYISLFAILYLIVAFSSFWHACAFFGLANNTWMSIILAFAFEVGQAAVLFSLLTSKKDRSRIMPWVLMTMFTLVQVIGNVFSSYKYLITHSVEDLKYFKEPIFIWMDLPDNEATVIITYVVGAILPVAALLLTSMITNYLTDIEEENLTNVIPITTENGPKNPPIILDNKEDFNKVYNDEDTGSDGPDKINIDTYNQDEEQKQEENNLSKTSKESTEQQNNTKVEKDNEELENLKEECENVKNNVSTNEDTGSDGPDKVNIDNDKDNKENKDKLENKIKSSHFINL